MAEPEPASTSATGPARESRPRPATGPASEPQTRPTTDTEGVSSTPVRLDALLAARGLVRSRTAAAKLVQAGRVTVAGVAVVKPSAPVAPDAQLVVDTEDEWVSRAALKLVHALEAFDVDPADRVVLDVGASTGGFTQVLLHRGARRVVALDVGHGQLDPVLAIDERVRVVEGCNARNLTAEEYTGLDPSAPETTLVVGDLSFISLRIVLPVLAEAVPADEFVLLVKPQFEVGRNGVREGIVRDAALREDAVMNVLWSAWDAGLGTVGLAASPIVGTHGNHEYLAHLQRRVGGDPAEWGNPTAWIGRATELTEGAA